MKNYYEHIKLKYSTQTCNTMKEYANLKRKIAKQKAHLRFLVICKEYGFTPTHINNATSVCGKSFTSDTAIQQYTKIEETFHTKLLKLEIKQININIKNTNDYLFQAERNMKYQLNNIDYTEFTARQTHAYQQTFNVTKEGHDKKIAEMKRVHIQNFGFTHNEEFLENKTNIDIPDDSRWLLSLGRKFTLPITKHNFSPIHVIADLEQYFQKMTDEREKAVARSVAANKITFFKNRIRNTKKEKFILNVHKQTKKFLKSHKNEIIVTQADKGNKTVIMYKQEYLDKMRTLLGDRQTYKTVRIDPTKKFLEKNNNIVKTLHNKQLIDTPTKSKLLKSTATAPRLYGLPKVHKPDAPLRPISSSFDVPCYNLSKHIGNILKNLISKTVNIKNSFQLKEKLENYNLTNDEILVSFDVTSLFTNIPVYLAIKIIMGQWDNIKHLTKIPRQQFLNMLEFCLKENNYFQFDTICYHQIYGMPMGNPLSPTIADIVLDKLLDDVTKDLEDKNIKMGFLCKYVDDILAVINKDDMNIILNTLNNYHEKIQFTIEIENNLSIPYLDLRLHRQQGKIIFDWYRKTTSSGRIINFHSTQPFKYKINTVTNLINKVLTLSDIQFREKNIEKLRTIFRDNDYPQNLIKNLIRTSMTKNLTNNLHVDQKQSGNLDNIKYYSTTYIPGLTDKKKIRKIVNDENAIFAYRSNTTLNEIFTNTKTKIDNKDKGGLVYQIKCLGGRDNTGRQTECKGVYIGQTKRSLAVRMTEHERDIKNKKTATAIAQHILDTNHTADFDNIKVLDIEKNHNRRLTLESLRIQEKGNNAINFKEDTDNINNCYTYVIRSNI